MAYTELGDEGIGDLLKLNKLSKKEGIGREQVPKLLQLADENNSSGLSQLEKQRNWLINKIYDFDTQIERSKNYLHRLNDDEIASAKALLNSYHVLCERKRKEAENLNNKLCRLEALVSQFKIKDEDYSNLKQIVTENVKVVLSDNKKLISISFVALIQTIKADPQMVKLIQTMPSANDDERQKNNIVKYLEFNKDSLLNLAQKHYENLVEVLTNNIIDTAEVSSSNPALSMPQSSSTFPNLSYNDTYRIEESETYHNNKGS